MISLNKKLLTILLSVSLLALFVAVAAGAEEASFIKKDSYLTSVTIESPETSALAEAFLRKGITVVTPPYEYISFTFKTVDEEDKFTVLIYYGAPSKKNSDSHKYVGKYIYVKNKTADEISSFTNSFVSWMLKNAWGRK